MSQVRRLVIVIILFVHKIYIKACNGRSSEQDMQGLVRSLMAASNNNKIQYIWNVRGNKSIHKCNTYYTQMRY